jgi:hypothetical protein
VEIHDPERPHADVKASRSSTSSVFDRPAIKKHLRKATPSRNGIRKMAFLISISSSSRKDGHRHINRRTQRYALLLMKRLRRSNPWKRPPKGHEEPQHHATMAYTSGTVDSGPIWVVDTGASRHFSAVLSDFSSQTMNDKLGTVSGIDFKIEGSGSISFFVHDRQGKHVQINLKDVLYVPNLSKRSGGSYLRLMSVRLTINEGYKLIFSKNSDILEHNDGIMIDLVRSGGLSWLPNHFNPTAARSVSRDLIHRHFGHLHEDGIIKLDRLGVRGASGFRKLHGSQFCPCCAIGKSRVVDINRESTHPSDTVDPLDTVAIDIWGPMSTLDLNGNRWALGAACYKTGTILCSLMTSKTEAASG